jgi:hypothetical protein
MDREKKEKMAMKSIKKTNVEQQYIEAICQDTYKNLSELNLMLKRREIISNINEKYIGLKMTKMTWENKLKSKVRGKASFYPRYQQAHEGEQFEISDLDSIDCCGKEK